MASTLQGKSPVRKNASLSPIPLNSMHTTTGDFFHWNVVKMVDMVQNDSINFSDDCFIQGAPNPFPINGSSTYAMHAFFIPRRLCWADWKYYILGMQDGLVPPYFTLGDLVDIFHSVGVTNPWASEYFDIAAKFISNIENLGSIIPYLYEYTEKSELPQEWQNFKLDAMPLRAIQLAWFDWCRDKMHISDNAKDSYCFTTGGHITKAELVLLCAPKYRNYPKNIFTASFDSPQEGAAVAQPVRIADSYRNPALSPSPYGRVVPEIVNDSVVSGVILSAPNTGSPQNVVSTNAGATRNIGQFSINDLRFSNAIQQYAERMLVAGKTVLSRAMALFGVSPTIEELQMSNWLGGNEKELQFNQHLSNSATRNVSTDVNEIGAFGLDPRYANISGQKGQTIDTPNEGFGLNNISYRTDESGFFLALGCLMPNVQYYEGLPKFWTKGLETLNSNKFDFFHSDLENQPLDPVYNYQISTSKIFTPKNVFGFQLYYSSYKEAFDSLGGDFLIPSSKALMASMHLGRSISDLISLLSEQTGITPDELLSPANLRQSTGYDVELYDSKFTIQDSKKDHFILNHKFTINMLRPMQLFCLPSLDADLSKVSGKNIIDTGGFSV